MKLLELLTERPMLRVLVKGTEVEVKRIVRESRGLSGGFCFSCEYYVNRIFDAYERQRHYKALLALGEYAFLCLPRAEQDILYYRYIKPIAGSGGFGSCAEAGGRSVYYRSLSLAEEHFEKNVRRVLEEPKNILKEVVAAAM